MAQVRGFGNIFKIEELKKKILFTLGIIIIYRIGAHIPIAGVNAAALAEFFKQKLAGTVFGLYDIFVGGALSRAAVFALGVMPHISASIIMQLLTATIPALERLHREGEHGRRVINRYTRYLTLVIAMIQGFGISMFLQGLRSPAGIPIVPNPGPGFTILTMITLGAGAVAAMWLGELISDYGVGNGISLLILVGSLDSIPYDFLNTINLLRTGGISPIAFIIFIAFALFLTAAVVAFTEAQRRIPIQYAGRQVGRRIYRGVTSYLPLTTATAGIIPIIFAQSVLMFPNTVATFVPVGFSELLNAYWRPGILYYDIPFALLIIFFAYFYTSVVINPKEMADNLQRVGAFIPGIRPGPKTAEYIDRVLSRIILPSAIFYALVALTPWYIYKLLRIPFYFGGTRLLIIVGVSLDVMRQIESYLIMRQYDSLLKKGKLRGWRR